MLLDEINLAPADVLEGLVPFLRRDQHRRTLVPVPGSDEDPVDVTELQVVATMNPVSVGGNRTKLSRSMENLFTVVALDGYNELEMRKILHNLFRDLLSADYNMYLDERQLNSGVTIRPRSRKDRQKEAAYATMRANYVAGHINNIEYVRHLSHRMMEMV
jgi:hypothetical protein